MQQFAILFLKNTTKILQIVGLSYIFHELCIKRRVWPEMAARASLHKRCQLEITFNRLLCYLFLSMTSLALWNTLMSSLCMNVMIAFAAFSDTRFGIRSGE